MGSGKVWSDEELEFLKNNFNLMTLSELSSIIGRTKSGIQLKANRIGLNRDKYFYDKNYFENINTEDKAYWLGFIYADGYINYDVKNGNYELGIELSLKDKEHLKKFNKSLNGNIEVGERYREGGFGNGKKYHTSQIRIYCKKMLDDLIKFGVIENKHDKITIPRLEKDLIIPFLRGYFDGDGCVCLNKERNSINFDFCSTSKKMLEDIRTYVYNNYNITSYISNEPMGNRKIPCYRLHFKGLRNGYNFGKLLYSDSKIHLDRKYNLFYRLSKELKVEERICSK